ncbi:MAG: N-acetylmuramoyl-L-alanine amidase [bacterium]|nr:N-acetylmuramoyl-L-alanine amidase [bacterium]
MNMETRLLAFDGPDKRSVPRSGRDVTHVLLHFMSNVAQNQHDPYDIEQVRQIFVDYKLSAHYIIARDGLVLKLVEEDRVAWHAGRGSLDEFPDYRNRLNNFSIGIEFLAIGSRDEMAPKYISRSAYDSLDPGLIGYTEDQYTAVNELLTEIYDRHPAIVHDRRHIIGHDEYAGPRQRPGDPKVDPGSLFDWSRVLV